MTCDSARDFLNAYVDRELDSVDSLNVEKHLKICDSCTQRRSQLEALRMVIATESPRFRAPEGLRSRIQANLRASAPLAPVPKKPVFDWAWDWKWGAIAASLLISVFALWQMQARLGSAQSTLIAREIVSSHVRSLMANHLVDEPSSDQHMVKPWFAGKLDFSPEVKNLDGEGFMLAGGRLDYLNNRPVAAIVYRRRQHVINLFVWPVSKDASLLPGALASNGFNTITWASGGLAYWAISDLNRQELELFSQLWARQ